MKNLLSLGNLKSLGGRGSGGVIQYLLLDTFSSALAAGSVNNTQADIGGARTVTDTNSKISISGGVLNFATGDTANDGIWYPSLTRTAGRVLLEAINTGGGAAADFGWDTDSSGALAEGIRLAGSVLSAIRNATLITVGSYTNSVDYKLACVLRSTGTYLFIKGGTEFPFWTLIFISNNSSTTPMFPVVKTGGTTLVATADNIRIPSNPYLPTPLAYDTFTRANGALGSTETTGPDSQGVPALVWTGSTWTIASNVAVNTLTQGASFITNPSFDTNTTGWTASGATLSSVAGGQVNNCLQVQNTGAAAGYAFQSFTTVVGQWYLLQVYYKNGTGGLGGNAKIGTTQGGSEVMSKNLATASFSPRGFAFRATATTTFISLQNTSTVSGDNTLFDEILLVPLTTSEMFASLATSTKDVIIDANNATGGGLSGVSGQAGVVLNLDSASNPQNFVIAYIDQVANTAVLIKCVAGVYTTVISAAVTFVSAATLRVIKDGTSYQLFYNNLKVGSTSTISDAAVIAGTIHGLFNPTGTNTLDVIQLMPRGSTNNEYAALESY